jgi:hypothetical protein
MPRIPPVIDAPPSCSFTIIRKPKAEKPRAKPIRLIAVDIFCSRLCVLILNSGCRFGCAGGSLLKRLLAGARSPRFRRHRLEPTRRRIEKRLERIPPPASMRRPQAPTLCPRTSDCGKPHPWRVPAVSHFHIFSYLRRTFVKIDLARAIEFRYFLLTARTLFVCTTADGFAGVVRCLCVAFSVFVGLHLVAWIA